PGRQARAVAADGGAEPAHRAGDLPGRLRRRPGQGPRVLRPAGGGLPPGAAAVRHPGQLVDPQAPRRGRGVEAVAAGRAGVAADVRAVAEPDREAVARAAAGGAAPAPAGRRLAGAAAAGAGLPGPVRARLTAAAGVRRLAGKRLFGPDGPWPIITD